MSKTKTINKQDAAYAVQHTSDLLFEASVLRDAAQFIKEQNHDCATAPLQIEVLRSVVEDKLEDASAALLFVNNYFQQKPAKRTKKKLAVVKAAA